MAQTSTDGERGKEFDGHEMASAARIRRLQESRNEDRLTLANETDRGRTGDEEDDEKWRRDTTTYLDNNEARAFLPPPVRGPDNSFIPPSWFIKALRILTYQPTRTPNKSPVEFETTSEAAERTNDFLASLWILTCQS